MKNNFQGLLISLSTVVLCLFVAEFYFRYYYAYSDGFGFTLSSKNWMEKYWKPINSLGYRDKEWSLSDLEGKKVIAIVGDSFVAGHGIENSENRFSNVLSKLLSNDYAVINIGQNGLGTRSEILAISKYPYLGKPKLLNCVIWSYFPNDIGDTASVLGKTPPNLLVMPSGLMKELVNNSYFINFIYWRIIRINFINEMGFKYIDWLKQQYADDLVWTTHKAELEQIVKLSKLNNIKVIVILFPFLQLDSNDSDFALGKVKDFFTSNNIQILEVSKLVEPLNKSERVVNSVDAHPSVKLHQIVGHELHLLINEFSK